MRLSIITPTIDTAHYVDEAILSVPRDEHADIEHIIVHDGADSFTDRLRAQYPHLKIIKGTGAGATAAVVEGIKIASGDFILHLSGDDRIVRGAIAKLAAAIRERPEVEIWTGGARIFRTDSKGGEVTVRRLEAPAVTALSLGNLLDDYPIIPARFCRRSTYEKLGGLDPGFSECSDREFLIRAALSGVIEAPLGVMVSELRMHADSRTMTRRAGWVPPYLSEHLRIADRWLAQSDIPARVAWTLRCWRSRELLRLLTYQVRAAHWKRAWQTLSRETVADPLWPLRAPTATIGWLRRRR